jgi:hypothetical protein
MFIYLMIVATLVVALAIRQTRLLSRMCLLQNKKPTPKGYLSLLEGFSSLDTTGGVNIAECLLGRYVPQLLVKSLMIDFRALGRIGAGMPEALQPVTRYPYLDDAYKYLPRTLGLCLCDSGWILLLTYSSTRHTKHCIAIHYGKKCVCYCQLFGGQA